MQIKNKKLWSIVAAIIACCTIVAVMKLNNVSLVDIRRVLHGANLIWLVPAVICTVLMVYFEGEAVRTIVRGSRYERPRRRGFLYGAADVYFAAITPSASGGQPASAYFMMKDGIPAAVTTAALLLNLVVYTMAIITIAIVTLLVRPQLFLAFTPFCRLLIVLGILTLTFLGLTFYLLLRRQKLLFHGAIKFLHFLHRIHLMKNPRKREEKLLKVMEEYRDCVRLLGGQRRMLLRVYYLNILQRVAQILVTIFSYLTLRGEAGKLFDLACTQVFVILGSNCVPIPGSMGVTDFLMLDGYGGLMNREKSVHLEILARGLSFYGCVLLSGVVVLAGYLLLRRRAKKLEQEQ